MNVSKQRRLALWTIAVAVLVAAIPLSAQPGKRKSGRMPKYDVAAEMTVQGTVVKVIEEESPMGWKGIHVILKSDESTYEVHIGPKSFLEDKAFAFSTGDEIAVLGAKWKDDEATEEDAEEDLLAREVTRGDVTLTLRDDKGFPAWRGYGPRSENRAGTD